MQLQKMTFFHNFSTRLCNLLYLFNCTLFFCMIKYYLYDKILKDKTSINGGNMFRKVKKMVRLQKLSKLGRKIVNTPYNRSDLVNNRFKEVNRILGENKLTKNEMLSLLNRGIEPVMHIHKNSFLILNFERHTFGVANFKTKKIIVPCEFYDIEFDKNNLIDETIEVKVLDLNNNIISYLINETATIKKPTSSIIYTSPIDKFSQRFGFSQNIEFKENNKNDSIKNGITKNSTTVDIVKEII